MKLRKDDYQDILEYLTKKRWEGEEFVAFLNDASPVVKKNYIRSLRNMMFGSSAMRCQPT